MGVCLLREEQTTIGFSDVRFEDSTITIRGVKLNGNRSRNKRFYDDPVLEAATPMFEGAKVFVDHEDSKQSYNARTVEDYGGRLRNVRFRAGGHRADLTFAPHRKHLYEMLKADPEAAGLSMVTEVRVAPRLDDEGYEHITEIVRVISVDLVSDPATTRSIFEQVTRSFEPQAPDPEEENLMSANLEQLKELYEARLKDKDRQIERLEEQASLLTKNSEDLRKEAETSQSALSTRTAELSVAREAIKVAEDKAAEAEMSAMLAESGLPESFAASLKGLPADAAKRIIESAKSNGLTEHRSENTGRVGATPRRESAGNGAPSAADKDAMFAVAN